MWINASASHEITLNYCVKIQNLALPRWLTSCQTWKEGYSVRVRYCSLNKGTVNLMLRKLLILITAPTIKKCLPQIRVVEFTSKSWAFDKWSLGLVIFVSQIRLLSFEISKVLVSTSFFTAGRRKYLTLQSFTMILQCLSLNLYMTQNITILQTVFYPWIYLVGDKFHRNQKGWCQ